MSLLKASPVYKPFNYPWAYEAWHMQQKIHWLPEEIPMGDDVKDWRYNITEGEKNLLTQIFRFFTQADIEVNNCLIDGSEILTPAGWKDFKNLKDDDLVAQVDEYLNLSFVKPIAKLSKYTDQDILKFSNKTGTVQIAVTDDHRMIYETHLGEIKESPAKDLKLNSNFFHHTSARIDSDNNSVLTPLEQFYIAAQADGSISSKNTITFEFKKERKIEMLRSILREAKLSHRTKPNEERQTVRIIVDYQASHDYIKNFAWVDLTEFNATKASHFLSELSFWDSAITNEGFTFTTTSKPAFDIAQAIASICQKRTRVTFRKSEGSRQEYWMLRVLNKYNPTSFNCINRTTQQKGGLVHCVQVPTGKILTRYNNSVSVTGNCYMKHYSRVFQPTEIQMMLSAFSNMETIHVAAYSHLLDTIGIPEGEYAAFLKYEEMKAKYDYMQGFNVDSNEGIAKTLAVFGAFTEGLQLFASFAILLNFPRHNKMKGMGQVVTWSVRDESLHCNSIIKLFKTFIEENPEVWNDRFKNELYEACKAIVHHEDAFIDLAFEMGDIEGLAADEVKKYIRFIGDRRLIQLGLDPIFGVKDNPLAWIDEILNGVEHANFFEARVTEYTKAATSGSWQDAFADLDIKFGKDTNV